MDIFLLIVAGALLAFAGGVVAGRWAWLALVVLTLVIYVSVGTGNDVPPDWMGKSLPVVPFAFIGVGIGIAVRRALRGDSPRGREAFSLLARSESAPARIEGESDLVEALGLLSLMLDVDFDGSEAYRRQLDVATLTRRPAGFGIEVNRSRAPAAGFHPARPDTRLPVEAVGDDDLCIRLHASEGYLIDLELLNGSRFPDPATVQIRST